MKQRHPLNKTNKRQASRRDNMTDKNMLIKFDEWLEKCPIDYDEHYQTSDDDITTINFHYKNIFNRNAENEQASEQKG